MLKEKKKRKKKNELEVGINREEGKKGEGISVPKYINEFDSLLSSICIC